MENIKNQRPFGSRDVIGYMFGDMAGSFVSLTFDAFYLIFATYVLKIDPKFMSMMYIFVRFYDAVDDPLIGSLPDRFRLSDKEKFKPWIKIFMWPLAISIILGFINIDKRNLNQSMKHVWVTLIYLIYGISYTGTSMPYGAMANLIATNQKEKSRLSAARSIGGLIIAFIVLGLAPMIIWDKNNNPNEFGYTIVSVICAIGSIISYLILNKFTIERKSYHKETDKNEDYNFFQTIKEALSNRSLVGIMIASIGSMIWITANNQFVGFMFKEFYNRPKLQTISIVSQLPITVLLFFIAPKLSERYGKRKTLTLFLIVNMIISTFLFLYPIKDPIVFILINILSNIGQAMFMIFVWAFVADAIDYHEYKFNSRNDGTLYSAYTFSRKIGTTIASAGATAALASIGFVSGAPRQSIAVANNIRYFATAIPIISCLLELVGIRVIYHLTEADSEKITRLLAKA
ncbi:MFS transporter [Anaerococcus sp. ENR0831]|uniref:MFS transporter n=1 Tax=Anaerococcus martiniensis TaxID=3115615 RepID=A0ABW9MAJ6_9FIRM